MAQPRWISPWRDSEDKPSVYHVVSRVVERRFAFGPEEKEKFRMLMRMAESFTGCRVLTYCVMSNHFHLLLEVPPPPRDGVADGVMLERLRVLYSNARVDGIGRELFEARERKDAAEVDRIRSAYCYRMHDLSEFMKMLLQRFSHWFNRTHDRTGRLWEQRFKSVLVEDGVASRTIAAYIDLNPVRAGVCEEPSAYRWSGYAEAVAGGKKARAGLVRALKLHSQEVGGNLGSAASKWAQKRLHGVARAWGHGVANEYRTLLIGAAMAKEGNQALRRKGIERSKDGSALSAAECRKGDLAISKVIRHRVRYFSDGVVIGGRDFVDQFFRHCRDRFGPQRKNGARKPRGVLSELAGKVWTVRDLQTGIG